MCLYFCVNYCDIISELFPVNYSADCFLEFYTLGRYEFVLLFSDNKQTNRFIYNV